MTCEPYSGQRVHRASVPELFDGLLLRGYFFRQMGGFSRFGTR